MVDRACAWCGVSLEGRSPKAKYCTKACGGKANRRPWVPKPPLIRCCIVCGSPFSVSRAAKTCSKGCSSERQRQLHKQWVSENRDMLNERERDRREQNADRVKLLKRQIYAANPERFLGYYKSWRTRNIDAQRARERSVKRSLAADRALSILILSQQPET